MRYHVKNLPSGRWVYEETKLDNVQNTVTLLARVTVAKVTDERRLLEILRTTPVVGNDPTWRCRTWVADVLSRLASDGTAVGTAILDWPQIEHLARRYVAEKSSAGRYNKSADIEAPKPTWNMLKGKEILP